MNYINLIWYLKSCNLWTTKSDPKVMKNKSNNEKMNNSINTITVKVKLKQHVLKIVEGETSLNKYFPVPVTGRMSLNGTSLPVFSIWRMKYHHLHIVLISFSFFNAWVTHRAGAVDTKPSQQEHAQSVLYLQPSHQPHLLHPAPAHTKPRN